MVSSMDICVGAGLISLDVLIRDGARIPLSYYVGGTCGNVMMILSYMGWESYPIARLDGTKDTARLLVDMKKNGVNTSYISTIDGKTPVIVQRNFVNKDGVPTHKFESRNGHGHFYLDFKSLTLKQAKDVIEQINFVPKVFFFDRVSPAFIRLAENFKEKGSIIYFEPSNKGSNVRLFNKCLEVSDVIKFSEQRIKDTKVFEEINDKLFIQTLGERGLRYRINSEWILLFPQLNKHIVDTAGAGDWTSAAFINFLYKGKELRPINDFSKDELENALNEAQRIGAMSCSFEGARGMMQQNAYFPQLEF